MTDTTELQSRLNALAADYARWRTEADELKARARLINGEVDESLLLAVEETASHLYQGIASFDALKADTEAASHAAGSVLAEVGEAIRLLLLEVTEFGTYLYSLRTPLPEIVQ